MGYEKPTKDAIYDFNMRGVLGALAQSRRNTKVLTLKLCMGNTPKLLK